MRKFWNIVLGILLLPLMIVVGVLGGLFMFLYTLVELPMELFEIFIN